MFLFLLIALVVVVGGVTLAVVGGGQGGTLSEAPPDRLDDRLPADRPLGRADVEALRLPMTLRGYRMADVDDALGRLGAELAERDARIAELEQALAGARGAVHGGPAPLTGPERADHPAPPGGLGDLEPDEDEREHDMFRPPRRHGEHGDHGGHDGFGA
ncbi:DivIVA domain-containing protein [Streptomyces sp. NA02950]|uniref:DivIVA domain-containing protein n=1 Tax=Streptomyces sp. NA02950 TaxID=2742137 RepID=UPI0015906021|nr:DivIVA domain-containing protein [Streptomyces sp. NA02950]QKV92723.1 DivIVA domain-containing protein [Streptomyces sp. NA02950]